MLCCSPLVLLFSTRSTFSALSAHTTHYTLHTTHYTLHTTHHTPHTQHTTHYTLHTTHTHTHTNFHTLPHTSTHTSTHFHTHFHTHFRTRFTQDPTAPKPSRTCCLVPSAPVADPPSRFTKVPKIYPPSTTWIGTQATAVLLPLLLMLPMLPASTGTLLRIK